MTLEEQLKALKDKIRALASKKALSPEDAGELEKLMAEAKAIQLQMAGKEMAGEGDPDPAMDAIDAKITKAIDPIIKALEKIPGLDAAGYITNMGGTKDPTHKSFGDFLLAVTRRDVKRLNGIYGSTYQVDKDAAGKTLEEDGGTTGGYLVRRVSQRTVEDVSMSSQVVGLVHGSDRSDAGSYPALDQFTAPTAELATRPSPVG
jgi:hypothetical protein